jgi:hypothetical protein
LKLRRRFTEKRILWTACRGTHTRPELARDDSATGRGNQQRRTEGRFQHGVHDGKPTVR